MVRNDIEEISSIGRDQVTTWSWLHRKEKYVEEEGRGGLNDQHQELQKKE